MLPFGCMSQQGYTCKWMVSIDGDRGVTEESPKHNQVFIFPTYFVRAACFECAKASCYQRTCIHVTFNLFLYFLPVHYTSSVCSMTPESLIHIITFYGRKGGSIVGGVESKFFNPFLTPCRSDQDWTGWPHFFRLFKWALK